MNQKRLKNKQEKIPRNKMHIVDRVPNAEHFFRVNQAQAQFIHLNCILQLNQR